MRRSVMTLSLCLSTLVLMAGKCDGDDVVTTSKDQPAEAADPNSVTQDAAAALGVEPGDPSAASVDEAVGAPDDTAGAEPGGDELGTGATADKGAGKGKGAAKGKGAGDASSDAPVEGAPSGGDGDIFTDPLTGEAPGTGPIDDLGDTPIEDSFLDDPSFEPEPPPVDEP